MGEAAAAAAEAALRTRGKLLADRTPGRDVRGPPRPLCPRAALGSRGRPCAPGPAGQQARGGGGNRARARLAGRRRRPRSSSLGATWKDGGGGALGLVRGLPPRTAGRCRPRAQRPPSPDPGPGGSSPHPLRVLGAGNRARLPFSPPPPLPSRLSPGSGQAAVLRRCRSPDAGAALVPSPLSRIPDQELPPLPQDTKSKLSQSFQPGPQPSLELSEVKTIPSGEY